MEQFKVKDIFSLYFQSHSYIESERTELRVYDPEKDCIYKKFSFDDWYQIFPNIDEESFNKWTDYTDRVILVALEKSKGQPFGVICIQESHITPLLVCFHGGVWEHSVKYMLLEYEATDNILHFLVNNGLEVYVTCFKDNKKADRFQRSLGFEEFQQDETVSYKSLNIDKLNTNIISLRKDNMIREDCLKALRDSITFQMSLGSKELFHTNFLEWLSVIDWDCFLKVMHKLAGTGENDSFWWVKENCPIEVVGINDRSFHPENGNIIIRREYNHYDLSIYILAGYTNPRKDGVPKPKWRPVLILENKVKSMPYQEQLNQYAQKAFGEWEQSYPKKKPIDSWEEKGVTFVLLTLFDETSFIQSKVGSNGQCKHDITWHKSNYQTLSDAISDAFKGLSSNPKAQVIIDDYCIFSKALHDLSKTVRWLVFGTDSYLDKIIKAEPEETLLRIADIREKVHHERMLRILVDKLEQSETLKGKHEHWNKEKEFKDPKGEKSYNTGIVFYETAFSRGTGATQVFVIINDDYRLMIQLQNNQYRRCLILHPTEEDIDNKFKRICDGLNKIWSGYARGKSFGKFFNYQYDPITNETVNDILDKVVSDLEAIFSNIVHLKNLR